MVIRLFYLSITILLTTKLFSILIKIDIAIAVLKEKELAGFVFSQ